MLMTSFGTLAYSTDPYRLVLNVCQDLANFYRKQVPKSVPIQPQRYQAHISVIRKEIPQNLPAWNRYQGHKIDFEYEAFVYNNDRYWWINCWSKRLEEIRVELGLPASSRVTRSPDGDPRRKFHITVGNTKEL